MLMEKATTQSVILAMEATAISGVTPVLGGIIDTKNFDSGLYFAMMCSVWAAGAADLEIWESDSATMVGAVVVAAKKLVYPDAPQVNTAVTAETTATAMSYLTKQACFSNLRYVQPRIVGTAAAADLSVIVLGIANPERSLKTAQAG